MIRVEIAQGVLEAKGHETLVGRKLIENLKEAGVPVLGEFAIRGVEAGSLLFYEHKGAHAFLYRASHEEDEEDDDGNLVDPVFINAGKLKAGGRKFVSGPHRKAFEEDDDL